MTSFAEEGETDERGADRQVMLRLLKRRTLILASEINRDSAQRVISQLLLLSEESPDEGERRFSLSSARFLIHQPSTGVHGDASDIEIEASEILKSRAKINGLIAAETGQKADKVENDTKRNFWMNASEALKYGLIGKVISDSKGL